METDSEAHHPSKCSRLLAHLFELLNDLIWRFSPSEIDVGMTGGYCDRGRRRTTEVDEWDRIGWCSQRGSLDGEVLPGEVDLLASPQIPEDRQKLVRPRVPIVLLQEVTVGALLGTLSTGNHVDQEPPPRLALERRSHLRCQSRRVEAG